MGGCIDRRRRRREFGLTTHALSAPGSFFPGRVLRKVTGSKSEYAHAWALPAWDFGYLGDGEALSLLGQVLLPLLEVLKAEVLGGAGWARVLVLVRSIFIEHLLCSGQ